MNTWLTFDNLVLIGLVVGVVLSSILAGRAEGRMWRAVHRYNGGRREMQRWISEGKAHLR